MILHAPNRENAVRYLQIAVESYLKMASKLSDWMKQNILEELKIFQVSFIYQRFLQTTNITERQTEEIKRQNRKMMLLLNEKSLLRLVSAILM